MLNVPKYHWVCFKIGLAKHEKPCGICILGLVENTGETVELADGFQNTNPFLEQSQSISS